MPASPRRNLNGDEERVLRLLLEAWDGGDSYAQQIPSLIVTGRCGCGCVTVYFESDPVTPDRKPDQPLPVEAALLTEKGEAIGGVLIFAREGRLTSLEAYSVEDPSILAWPPSQQIVIRPR
jgi:hypothetical protein